MRQSNQALEEAMAVVERLPAKQQRQLAARLLEKSLPDESLLFLYLKRLSSQKQSRLAELMEKHNEGDLTRAEKTELKQLNDEVSQVVLDNSITLAKALRPERLDKRRRRINKQPRRAMNK